MSNMGGASLKAFKIRTKNSVYEFEPILNRYRKIGNDRVSGWKMCVGSELKTPIMLNRFTIPHVGGNLSTSCIREIFQ